MAGSRQPSGTAFHVYWMPFLIHTSHLGALRIVGREKCSRLCGFIENQLFEK